MTDVSADDPTYGTRRMATAEERAELDPRPAANGAGPSPASILGQLRARRDELAADRHLDLVIPGLSNGASAIVARYRPLPWTEVRRRTERLRRPGVDAQAELNTYADLLVAACEQVMVRREPGAPLEPLSDDGPVRFDGNLAKLLGLSVDTSRRVLLGLFANDNAVIRQGNELTDWMTETESEAADELVGESGPSGA